MWRAGTRTIQPERATAIKILKRKGAEVLRGTGTSWCGQSREPGKDWFEKWLEKWAGSCKPCDRVWILFYMQWEITDGSSPGEWHDAQVGRIMSPTLWKGVHIWMAETCVYITLHGKRDMWIWLRILRGGDYPGLSNVITRIPIKGKRDNQTQKRRCDKGRETEVTQGCEPRNASSL